jgi:hypothetical protein
MEKLKKSQLRKNRVKSVTNVKTILDDKLIINIVEFAAILGCSIQHLYIAPPIPPIKVGGSLRWRSSDVKTLIA